jgi:hypothetical protein
MESTALLLMLRWPAELKERAMAYSTEIVQQYNDNRFDSDCMSAVGFVVSSECSDDLEGIVTVLEGIVLDFLLPFVYDTL